MKKKLWHEEDDTLQKEIENDREDYEKYLKDFKGIKPKVSGIPAESPLDALGRNCPRCAGRLVVKEITERNKNVLLRCKSCGIEVFAEDIDYRDPLSDSLYRTIPDSLMVYWKNFQKNRKR